MAITRALSNPVPPAWTTLNTHVILWHGSVLSAAADIQANGIDPTRGRFDLDFGRGFYTTTSRPQASRWASIKHLNLRPGDRLTDRLALLGFGVPLDALASLDSLMFVRGDARHEVFWSLVQYCRQSTPGLPRTHCHPGRAAPDDWYDVVCGPLAATWPPRGRVAVADSDQFSFHTPAGVGILEKVMAAGPPNFRIEIL